MNKSTETLPDVLEKGLRVVFCGTAAGNTSARVGAYYAGPGNKFWPTLYRTGLTPRQLAPVEFRLLPSFGVGLTDIAKFHSGGDAVIPRTGYDSAALREKILRFAPRVLAFNGKNGAREVYGVGVEYGRQPGAVGSAIVFVLPSTSGAANGFWNEAYWRELSEFT